QANTFFKRDIGVDLSTNFRAGTNGLLLWVESYNGLADDPNVKVIFVVSPGTEDGGRPGFDGGDIWSVVDKEGRVVGGHTIPSAPRADGYVSGGVLVVKTSISIALGPGAPLELHSAVLAANIAKKPDGTFYLSTGAVSGRAPSSIALAVLGGIENP